MNKQNQEGFSVLEIIIVLVILFAVGSTGWYIYSSNHKLKTIANNATTASSSKTSQSTTSTQPIQTTVIQPTSTEISNWLLYKIPNNTYRLRLPDGWHLTYRTDLDKLFTDEHDKAATLYKAGTRATVK